MGEALVLLLAAYLLPVLQLQLQLLACTSARPLLPLYDPYNPYGPYNPYNPYNPQSLEPKRNPTDLNFLQTAVFVPPFSTPRSSHTIPPPYCLSRPNYIGTQAQPTHTAPLLTLTSHISTEHLPPNSHLKYPYQTSTSSQNTVTSFVITVFFFDRKTQVISLNHIIDSSAPNDIISSLPLTTSIIEVFVVVDDPIDNFYLFSPPLSIIYFTPFRPKITYFASLCPPCS
ncbi:hypothetical protein EYC84_005605 [Monilinia fructicola]|uniref:Uncharacterized protein n=1 Tax=Monilinia fructicola TaxID=38448 RepID=A0A5M9JXW6_MONFR|nr:hypothetical protein EYC84_005605 [Monilinia fructicola]